MTSAEREVLLKELAESRERLLGLVQGLSREQRQYRPAPGRWSVAEIVEHVATVENRILALVEDALKTAPDTTKRSALEDHALLADVAGLVTRFQAPEFLVPTGKWQDDELTQQFEAARKRTREFAAATDADLRRYFRAHPVFGELDCYQWLRMAAAHCDRHRAQGEEVKASAGFPRAASAR